MLPLTRKSVPRVSPRVNVLLALAVIGVLALPTVYLSVAPRAVADEPAQPAPPAASESSAAASEAPAKPATPKAAPVSATYTSSEAAPPAVEYLPPPTASEKRIAEALNSVTEFDFVDTPIGDVVQYIKDRYNLEIQLERRHIAEAGLDQNLLIRASLEGISLRSALRIVLEEHDLTFVPVDEVLKITTRERAESILIIRTYPIADLLGKATGPEGQSFVKTITSSVDPASWENAGGPGELSVVGISKSLVISQTYDNHEKILELLRSLREARQLEQPQAEIKANLILPRNVPGGAAGSAGVEKPYPKKSDATEDADPFAANP